MMQIHTKNIFRVLALSFLFGIFSSVACAQQQWGVVEKSKETQQIGNQVYYIHIVARGNTFFSLAKVYGVSVEDIKEANPGLDNELKLGSVILIPKPAQAKPVADYISNDKYFYHVVKQGESLFGIAKIFGVKVEDLQRINNLNTTSISPGFHLKVPEQKLKEEEIPKNTEQQVTSIKDRYFEHTVQPKETLYSIAKKYGIGVETLKYINNLTGNDIQPGQVLLIPSALKKNQDQEAKIYIIHQVQPKEGLYGIARKYGVSIEQIKAMNPGLTEYLSIGQEIKIPRKANTNGFIEHQVSDRKEKLTDIAREYDVSVSKIKKLNPELSKKVSRGETVYIPLDFVDQKKEILTDQNQKEEQFPTGQEIYPPNRQRVFNIALMLPLYLNEVDSMLQLKTKDLLARPQDFKSFRFIEFYEGAMIAIDSLRKAGMKVNVQVYDLNDDDAANAMLLQDPALQKLDLIISLLYTRSFTMVSNFSKEYHIPLVNAISKRGQIAYENPYVFKLSPNPDSIYNRTADFVGKHLANYNIIIVRSNPYQFSSEYALLKGLLQQKVKPKVPLSNAFLLQRVNTYMKGKDKSFLNTLQSKFSKDGNYFSLNELSNRPFDTTWVNNSIKTVIYSNDSLRGIMEKASLFRNNLIIALGSEEVFAIDLFTQLNYVRDSLKIKVIGLPDWQNFQNLDVDYSQEFSLRVSSESFVDYNSPAAIRFANKFQNAYNKPPELDTYSYLGYDAAFYFLEALFRLGDDWFDRISSFHIPLLQNQFRFERLNGGGYENTYWNLYRQENYQYKLEK